MNDSISTIAKGKLGEHLALEFYRNQGFELLEQNYRYKRSEIDLIVKNDILIVFVEVKFRKNAKFGYPEEFVSKNQEQMIISGADYYIETQNWLGNIRFDIIAIDGNKRVEHFEDAFY